MAPPEVGAGLPASIGTTVPADQRAEFVSPTPVNNPRPAPSAVAVPAAGPSEAEPPPAGEAATAEATPGPTGTALAALAERLASVEAALTSQDARAAARERVIDRLHDENQRLKSGERQLLLLPLLTDLRRLHADLLRQATSLPAEMSTRKVSDLLESFAWSVEATLDRCGVQVSRPKLGALFDPRRHRAVETIDAAEPGLDGTVAAVREDGYFDLTAERTLQAAAVTVYRWPVPQDKTPPATE
jgi:molecular chaperone GrpE